MEILGHLDKILGFREALPLLELVDRLRGDLQELGKMAIDYSDGIVLAEEIVNDEPHITTMEPISCVIITSIRNTSRTHIPLYTLYVRDSISNWAMVLA